jgi:hypothetical protein
MTQELWPLALRQKLATIRRSKLAQIYDACGRLIKEYLTLWWGPPCPLGVEMLFPGHPNARKDPMSATQRIWAGLYSF